MTKLTNVYKLTRQDGKEYIGVAINYKSRLWQHKRSKRFEELPIIHETILQSFEKYENALLYEKEMIEEYNTFHGGLNNTPDGSGNHRAPSFTTKGYSHTETTKAKIRNATIKNKNHKYAKSWYDSLTPEEKKNKALIHSKKTKGVAKPTQLSPSIIQNILENWFIHKPTFDNVGIRQQNGKDMTYIQAFSLHFSTTHNISPRTVRNIVNNKIISWKPLYEQIQNMKS